MVFGLGQVKAAFDQLLDQELIALDLPDSSEVDRRRARLICRGERCQADYQQG
jgi:hypothetical protein